MGTHDASPDISDRLFLDYLQCKHKAFLKLSGESGVKSDFEKFQDENHAEYCLRARERLLTTGDSTAISTVNSSFKEIKKQNISVAVGISISNDHSLILDAAELSSQSSPRKPVYNPIILLPHQKISKQHKLLLAFYGSALGHEQKREPASGRIIFGDNLSSTKVQLTSLIKTVGKIEKEITNMIDKQTAPPLRLNDHCKICEFKEICYAAAKEKDDLSLLKGLSGKEIDTLNKRGIFTVTQYSYTFRPRRAKKMMSRQILRHHHSLNALAIRTQTIYISGKPVLPSAATRVYLDVEGIPDENFYYLIGLVIDDGKNVSSHSLWANDKSKEKIIWGSFLEKMEALKDFVLFHYGSYETKFLKQMDAQYGDSSELLEKIKSCSFNVLSAIYGHIYFPTYSNDLKSIASFLGFKWSEHNASGFMSLLWRQQWESSREETVKQRIITYNHEDCLALRLVEEELQGIVANDGGAAACLTKNADEIKAEKPLGIFKRNEFFFPEFTTINKCAYFDYQRSKVYLRTSSEIKKAIAKPHRKKAVCRVNKELLLNTPRRCPLCGSLSVVKHTKHSRIVYDLKVFNGGVKRWIIRYRFHRCLCKKCNRTFQLPKSQAVFSSKYGRNLFAWVIYQSIGRLISQNSVAEDLGETFGYRLPGNIVPEFKELAANYYKESYNILFRKISEGRLIHIDETKISAKGTTNYVWAITDMDSVVYIHSGSREGEMIREKLSRFNGVLVSDFYTAYDSFSCQQQKCLIHLIRDINEDILKNPFDEELKEVGRAFAILLAPIIETIDKYGLKQRHLNKHKAHVRRFFRKIEIKDYASDLAKNFQRRFLKYHDKLFTFLDYDSVPWNNNNAEHAIKRFALLRKVIGGSSSAKGIQEYLVLLSICETLRLRNASFFRFLLSGATDIDKVLEGKTNRLA